MPTPSYKFDVSNYPSLTVNAGGCVTKLQSVGSCSSVCLVNTLSGSCQGTYDCINNRVHGCLCAYSSAFPAKSWFAVSEFDSNTPRIEEEFSIADGLGYQYGCTYCDFWHSVCLFYYTPSNMKACDFRCYYACNPNVMYSAAISATPNRCVGIETSCCNCCIATGNTDSGNAISMCVAYNEDFCPGNPPHCSFGYIYELRGYSDAMSVSDKNAIVTELKNKWKKFTISSINGSGGIVSVPQYKGSGNTNTNWYDISSSVNLIPRPTIFSVKGSYKGFSGTYNPVINIWKNNAGGTLIATKDFGPMTGIHTVIFDGITMPSDVPSNTILVEYTTNLT